MDLNFDNSLPIPVGSGQTNNGEFLNKVGRGQTNNEEVLNEMQELVAQIAMDAVREDTSVGLGPQIEDQEVQIGNHREAEEVLILENKHVANLLVATGQHRYEPPSGSAGLVAAIALFNQQQAEQAVNRAENINNNNQSSGRKELAILVNLNNSHQSVNVVEANSLCLLCKRGAQNAVITICGHFFCWPCLGKHKISHISQFFWCPQCHRGLRMDEDVISYYESEETENKDNGRVPSSPNTKWFLMNLRIPIEGDNVSIVNRAYRINFQFCWIRRSFEFVIVALLAIIALLYYRYA